MARLLLSFHYVLKGARYSEIRGGQHAAWRKTAWLSRFSRPEPAEGWQVKCLEPGQGHKDGSAVFLADSNDGTHGKLGWLDTKLYEAINCLRGKGFQIELRLRGLSDLEVQVHGEDDGLPEAETALRQFADGCENKRSFVQAQLNSVLRSNPDRLRERLSDGCGICLSSDWSAGALQQESACITPCLHVFHTSCMLSECKTLERLQDWKSRCPTCRQSLCWWELSSLPVPAELDEGESVTLGPAIKKARRESRSFLWTDAETDALKRLHAEHGNKWKLIRQRFDFRGKTSMQLKDKMRSLLVPSY